jgi:hypothetical protein
VHPEGHGDMEDLEERVLIGLDLPL